jgi:D-3-phosphoglycerate dehydrogenase
MRELGPFLPVAEKVALLATQLSEGQLADIEIEYLGDIGQHDTTPLRAAVIKGLVARVTEENVTIVNANLIAENRGLRIVERKGPSEGVFANLIRVHIHASASETDVTGTAAHDGPHIVQINEDWIDIPPGEGWLLLLENQDRPGMIGAVGMLLGKHDINIGDMKVGRTAVRGKALMAVLVDDPVPPDVIKQLTAIPNILSARVAKFS